MEIVWYRFRKVIENELVMLVGYLVGVVWCVVGLGFRDERRGFGWKNRVGIIV